DGAMDMPGSAERGRAKLNSLLLAAVSVAVVGCGEPAARDVRTNIVALDAQPSTRVTLFDGAFVRETGKPQMRTAAFVLPADVGPPFTVLVFDDAPSIKTSSANVSIGGAQLLVPSDFPLAGPRTISLPAVRAQVGAVDV